MNEKIRMFGGHFCAVHRLTPKWHCRRNIPFLVLFRRHSNAVWDFGSSLKSSKPIKVGSSGCLSWTELGLSHCSHQQNYLRAALSLSAWLLRREHHHLPAHRESHRDVWLTELMIYNLTIMK